MITYIIYKEFFIMRIFMKLKRQNKNRNIKILILSRYVILIIVLNIYYKNMDIFVRYG